MTNLGSITLGELLTPVALTELTWLIQQSDAAEEDIAPGLRTWIQDAVHGHFVEAVLESLGVHEAVPEPRPKSFFDLEAPQAPQETPEPKPAPRRGRPPKTPQGATGDAAPLSVRDLPRGEAEEMAAKHRELVAACLAEHDILPDHPVRAARVQEWLSEMGTPMASAEAVGRAMGALGWRSTRVAGRNDWYPPGGGQ